MSLNADERALIETEESALKTTIESLSEQRAAWQVKLAHESRRARELTSEIVKTRRDEEKALLASDEAVAHGLAHKKQADIKSIEKMLDKPYFARFEVEEEQRGALRKIEYKLGFTANSDCRIMDWRKAPVSKLYYDYQEGEDYCEEIQGQERSGRVTLRHALEIKGGKLSKISAKGRTFELKDSAWTKGGVTSEGHHQSGGLPHILSLITPEQFALISEQAHTPLLIQGIAGSGKTSVALHRLAFLLHEDNSDVRPENVLFVVLSATLKQYVCGTLPAIGVEGVRVLTFSEWVAFQFQDALPRFVSSDGTLRRSGEAHSSSVARALRSMAILAQLESVVTAGSDPLQGLLAALGATRAVLERDESKLLDRELVERCHKHACELIAQDALDRELEALLLRAIELSSGTLRLADSSRGKLQHIAADEIQDFSCCELACLVAAVRDPSDLTLVGDTAQGIDQASSFPGWQTLRRHWGFKDSITRFVSLQVSHRNTNEIMRLAEHVLHRPPAKNSRNGRIPIMFRCRNENGALAAALKWLSQALQRYPAALSCVVAPDAAQARMLEKLLRPTFGNTLRLGSGEDFSFEQGLVVCELAQVKGLEFVNVLIWDVSNKNYPADQIGRQRLYLAITRAAENLALVNFGAACTALPQHASTLLRIVDQESEIAGAHAGENPSTC